MFRFVRIAFLFFILSSSANAQWVTSGSGMGARTGDQGLTNADGLAQSLGYADQAAMDAAAAQGYGPNAADGALWTAATSGQYDTDCNALFGADCDELDSETFRPQKPITEAALNSGFTGAVEQDAYLAVCGGGLTDAQRCKQKGYAATQMDGAMCQMSVTDNDNAPFCRARLNLPEGTDGDCSDLDRDDYEDIVNNTPPQIVLPADWTPPSLSTADSPATQVFQFQAVDADGDPLTWSVRDPNGVFAINGQGMLSLSAALGAAGQNAQTAEVKVSDGIAFDVETVRFDVTQENRPPSIIAPQDWVPSEVARTTAQGDVVVNALSATDPDDDPLSWSIASSDLDVFTINAQTGVLSLSRPNGFQDFDDRPATVNLTIRVSDGELTDDYDLAMRLQEPNGPPRIIVPADWQPAAIAASAVAGDPIISQLSAVDPNGDTLTWSISNMDFDVFQIDPQSAVVTLYEGDNEPEENPDSITLTVQVSDGELSDTMTLKLDVEYPNRPPQIVVPEGFASKALPPYAEQNTSVGTLQGSDPDGDTLSWSLLDASPQIFAINAQTGALSYRGIGDEDKLACEAAESGPSSPSTAGGSSSGIASTNSNVMQDHGSTDFRSKKTGGQTTSTGKYHVVIERTNHRGGSFTTEARSAASYAVNDAGQSISVPALRAATINSNLTPINSYLVFQNNSQVDMRNTNGEITFANPILGLYYTDAGFDGTITRLGKPNALYSRQSQHKNIALENGRDIAWIDPIDRRKLHFRSRTANVGDFMRVITAAAGDDGEVGATGPDICSATVTVQLSDGEETDEEMLTLAFGDPNRAPEIIAPADWVPAEIANNSQPNDDIVSVLASRDPDGDTLRWSLSGDNADMFSINQFDGTISLSPEWDTMKERPNEATVLVQVTDGRLSDVRELNFTVEEAALDLTDVSFGLSGKAAFVGGGAPIAAPFNGTYTIFTRFYKGDQGVSEYEYKWKKTKKGTRYIREKTHVPQTIFSHNNADGRNPNDAGDATHLYIRNGKLAIKIGSSNNHNITATNRPVGRGWHTAMIVVDREGLHQRAGCRGSGWPVKKFYLDGNLLPLSKPHINRQQSFYSGCNFSGQIRANSFMTLGVGDGFNPPYQPDYNSHRERPLHPSHGLHEVTIWAGDMSQHANEIMTASGGTNYPEAGVPMPVYWWKPGLIGEAETADGEVTMTVPNLANGEGPKGRPLAGNGRSREAGDMHLYAGRFKFVKISGNDWQANRDQDLDHLRKYGHAHKIIGLWHQGTVGKDQPFNPYFDVNALPQFERQTGDNDDGYRDRIRNEIRKFGLRDLN